MMKIKVFISQKTNKKVVCLVAVTDINEYYLTFDIGAICDICDKTPSMLAKLEVGYYDV